MILVACPKQRIIVRERISFIMLTTASLPSELVSLLKNFFFNLPTFSFNALIKAWLGLIIENTEGWR